MDAGQKPKRAGIMGWPVDHSLSPRVHGFWLRQHGLDGRYDLWPVAPDDFAKTLAGLPAAGFVGVNITVPHKRAAWEAAHHLDADARRMGAVNTIVVEADGTLSGRNTDAFGFMENIYAARPDWQARSGPVVVLGAGGAARAVVVALMDAGVVEIRLLNRTPERAEALARDLGGVIIPGALADVDKKLRGATLLVNTTILGMVGKPPLCINENALAEGLAPDAIVNDIVYTPLRTPLLHQAEREGFQAIDGLGMLLHQARPAFAAWFGPLPDVTPELRRHVLAGPGNE